MKSFAHLAAFSLALAVAGLGSGCATSTPTATYRQPAQDFEVVESSTDRPLTDSEKAEVRASVASYLDREGVSDSGDYFLKVYLTPENVDAESDWVVVRFTRYTDQRVAVMSSYPYDNYMYSSYYPYYAYDIYPYGYGCVARISFQYYVDPFYHQRYYYYPYRGHGRKGDHHDTAHNHGGKPRDTAHNHGGKPRDTDNHGGPRERSGPPPAPPGSRYTGNLSGKPVDKDAPVRPNRNNPNPPVGEPNTSVTADGGPQSANPRSGNQWRGRPGTGTEPSGVANNGNRPEAPNRTSNQNPRTHDYRRTGAATASTPTPVDGDNSPPSNRSNPNPSTTGPTPDVAAGAGPQRDNSRNQWRGRPGTSGTPSGVANNRNRPDSSNRTGNPNPSSQDNRPMSSDTVSTSNPAGSPSAQRRYDRPDQRPTPSRVNNPTRSEAYVAPSTNRPAPTANRPAPAQRSAPTANRPAPSYTRPSPAAQQTRAPAPSYQQPSTGSASSSSSRGDGGESRQNGSTQREAMR